MVEISTEGVGRVKEGWGAGLCELLKMAAVVSVAVSKERLPSPEPRTTSKDAQDDM